MKKTSLRGRKPKSTLLTPEQRMELERLARRYRSNRGVAFRAKIILLSSRGVAAETVSKELRTCRQTVQKWRTRFLKCGVDALFEEKRPGAPRQISDDKIEEIVVKTLQSRPKEATHWSTRLMAEKVGLSQSAISRIWRTFGLKPHRASTYALSQDPLFIEKVRDVVGLYMSPPANALVLSVDEKSQIQALNRTQPILPMGPGSEEKRTPDYDRHGTTTLFAALNVKTGTVIGQCYPKHRSLEFRKFLEHVEENTPQNQDIHMILDNYGTHKSPLIHRWLLRHPRFHLHFIPTHSSWLNLVERWFAMLTERQIKRGSHTSVAQLKRAITEYIEQSNHSAKPFIWTKTADEILEKVGRLASRVLQAHT